MIITTVAGNAEESFSGDNGPAVQASLNGPERIAVDSNGNLWIADIQNRRVRKVDRDSGTITTVVGNLFIADVDNLRIRHVDAATGIMTTFAGGGNDSGDNIRATAAEIFPAAISFDGRFFLIGFFRPSRRKIDTDGKAAGWV